MFLNVIISRTSNHHLNLHHLVLVLNRAWYSFTSANFNHLHTCCIYTMFMLLKRENLSVRIGFTFYKKNKVTLYIILITWFSKIDNLKIILVLYKTRLFKWPFSRIIKIFYRFYYVQFVTAHFMFKFNGPLHYLVMIVPLDSNCVLLNAW